MSFRLYDTATREIRDFVPVTPGKVGIYHCGLTVQGPPTGATPDPAPAAPDPT